jgi:tetratricopeptide (TPR) repeat protein
LGKGDVSAAIGVLEHVRDVCRARFVEYWLPIISASLGLAYAAGGRLTEAFPLLEEARERLSAPQNVIYQSLLLTSLSETSLLAGRPAEAAQHAEEALRVAIHRGERGIQAHALRLLGNIAASREAQNVEQSEQHYREALALADALGMRTLVAHCHYGLGTLVMRTGTRQDAQEHLAAATRMYRDMGMAFWLQKAESAKEA